MLLAVVDKEERAAAYVAKPSHTVRKLLWLRLTKLPLAEDMVLHMERASHDCTER